MHKLVDLILIYLACVLGLAIAGGIAWILIASCSGGIGCTVRAVPILPLTPFLCAAAAYMAIRRRSRNAKLIAILLIPLLSLGFLAMLPALAKQNLMRNSLEILPFLAPLIAYGIGTKVQKSI